MTNSCGNSPLFYVEKDGEITWPWMTGATLSEAGSPELAAALQAFRSRNNIENMLA
jgi:hypothetical protein